jgi:hypothetical protein
VADLYTISRASAAVTAAGILMEFAQPGAATTPRAKISEIDVFWNAGASTSISFGIGRPGNTPTTGTQVTGLPVDPASPTGSLAATVITGWGTAPTIPTTFHRLAAIASSAGNGVIWTFPPGQELVVPPNNRAQSLVLWCTAIGSATSTTLNVTWVWSE